MPGVGKTNTAVEYVYRHRKEYEHVFWITADSEESLQAGYDALAKKLGLVSATEQDQGLGISTALQWLAQNDSYLLVLDNADEINSYEHLVPQTEAHVLFTARPNTIKVVAPLVPVIKMKEPEGADCLLTCAGIRKPTPQQRAEAEAVSKDLDGLPLALRQAGAYIAASDDDITGYRALLATHRSELLKKTTGLTQDARTVYGTFTLALTKLEAKHSAASELLRLCAFLAPDAITESLFTNKPEKLPAPLNDVASNSLEWEETLQAAASLALIERDSANKAFSVHRLVQDVLRTVLSEADKKQHVEQVAHLLCYAHPGTDIDSWYLCEQLTDHQLLCLADIEKLCVVTDYAAGMCNQAGYYLQERGAYSSATPFLTRALAICEIYFGPDHPRTANSLNNLACLYDAQGSYAVTEPLYIRAIAIREAALGSDHPDTASSLNNLAGLYSSQGEYAKAEPLYVRATGIYESVLGPNHPKTAVSLNNLASLYNTQGEYTKAESLYARALAIREAALGPNHLETASSLNNLASLYNHQGLYAKEQPLLIRALKIYESILEPNHPDIATVLSNLALSYNTQGDYAKAEPLCVRALAIREAALGPNHPETAVSLSNLSGLYTTQKLYTEAESLCVRTLAIREAALGPNHPETANTLNNLAGLYDLQGDYAKAEPLCARALAIREAVLGPNHPKVATILNNLAHIYCNSDRLIDAEALLKRVAYIREDVLGLAHPDTASAFTNWAVVLRALNRIDESAEKHTKAQSVWKAHHENNSRQH